MAHCLVISAPASGAGKTTLTLALARAYRDRGLGVQCFKSGPDYIDPPSTRRRPGAARSISIAGRCGATRSKGLSRAGVTPTWCWRGLDGAVRWRRIAGDVRHWRQRDLAEMMDWPVLLVLDPAGQAQTAAAVAAGLRDFRKGVRIAGVILNRVASPRHEDLVRRAMEGAGIAVLGALRGMHRSNCLNGILVSSRRRSLQG